MKFRSGDIVRHRKGGDYVVIGTCVLEKGAEEAYLYRELGGAQRLWAREILEMEDGRFTLVGKEEVRVNTRKATLWYVLSLGTALAALFYILSFSYKG